MRANNTSAPRAPLRKLVLPVLLAALFLYGLADWSRLERMLPPLDTEPARPVTQLHPLIAAKQKELTAEAARVGIRLLITEGFRSEEKQEELYRQGRSGDGRVVTNARGGESYHNYGLAIDFALLTKDGKAIWDLEYDGNRNGKADWMEVVAIAKRLGFTWGGDWTSFPDYPHLQMDFGYSIRELKRGHRPPDSL